MFLLQFAGRYRVQELRYSDLLRQNFTPRSVPLWNIVRNPVTRDPNSSMAQFAFGTMAKRHKIPAT